MFLKNLEKIVPRGSILNCQKKLSKAELAELAELKAELRKAELAELNSCSGKLVSTRKNFDDLTPCAQLLEENIPPC